MKTYIPHIALFLLLPCYVIAQKMGFENGNIVISTGAIGLSSTDNAVNITTGSGTADDFTVNATQFIVEGDTGNVGIGTGDPVEALDIQAATGHATVSLWAAAGGTNEAQFDFVSGSDTTRLYMRASDQRFGIFHLGTTVFAVNSDGSISINQLGTPLESINVNGTTAFAITRNLVQLTCTGAETITTITGGRLGQFLTIFHEDTDCTLNDTDDNTQDQLDLTGSNGDIVGAEDLVVQLIWEGTHWLQVSLSQN